MRQDNQSFTAYSPIITDGSAQVEDTEINSMMGSTSN